LAKSPKPSQSGSVLGEPLKTATGGHGWGWWAVRGKVVVVVVDAAV